MHVQLRTLLRQLHHKILHQPPAVDVPSEGQTVFDHLTQQFIQLAVYKKGDGALDVFVRPKFFQRLDLFFGWAVFFLQVFGLQFFDDGEQFAAHGIQLQFKSANGVVQGFLPDVRK